MNDESEKTVNPCAEKLSYETRELAMAAASYAVWQYGEGSTKLKAYKCRHCGSWHLASDHEQNDPQNVD